MKNYIYLLIACLLFTSPLMGNETSQQVYSNENGKAVSIDNAVTYSSGFIIVSNVWDVVELNLFAGQAQKLTTVTPKLPAIRSNQRLIVSANGNYLGRLTFVGAGDYIEVSLAEVFIIDGKPVYRVESPGFSEAVLSNRGKLVGLRRNINIADKSELLFFDEQGVLVHKEKFPFLNQVKISNSGAGVGAVSGKNGLVIYNMSGEELAQLGHCQWFDLSVDKYEFPNDKPQIFCAYTNGSKIGFYTNIGQEIFWEEPYGQEVFRDVKVWKTGKNIEITAVSKHNLYNIAGETGEVIWDYKVESPVSFTSCDIYSTTDKYIAWGWEIDEGRAVPQNQRHVRGGFSLAAKEYLKKDFTIRSEDMNYNLWNVFTPKVEFTRGGLMIQSRSEVRFLQLNEGGSQR